MGINQIAAIVGSLGGLLLGGLLATIDWRLVVLVSVPSGLHLAFYVSAGVAVAAIASFPRGRRYVHGQEAEAW